MLSALFLAALLEHSAYDIVAFAMLRYWLRDAAEVAVSCHSAISCFRLHRVAAVVCKRNVVYCNWEIDAVLGLDICCYNG